MIDLTPLEVRQKKGDFRHALRGYDPELVNDFLDLVADRLEDLVKENMALRDAARAGQEELTAYRQKEQALSEALMAAQRVREDARTHAEKERELAVREAHLAARSARVEATRQIAREEEALRQVRARRAQLVESFRRLLERELSELAVIEETLELRAQQSTPDPGAAERTAGPPPEVADAGPDEPAGSEPSEPARESLEASLDEPGGDAAEEVETLAEDGLEEPLAERVDEPLMEPPEESRPEPVPGSLEGPLGNPFESPVAEPAAGLAEEPADEPADEPVPSPLDEAFRSSLDEEVTVETDETKRDGDAAVEDDDDMIDLPEDWLSSIMKEESPPRE